MAALTGEDKVNFYLGFWVDVSSSNVAAAKWDSDREELAIRFLNGSTYLYPGIGQAEAGSFASASSKGGWVWDQLRRPGRPFARVG